jgi:hypothetical protein
MPEHQRLVRPVSAGLPDLVEGKNGGAVCPFPTSGAADAEEHVGDDVDHYEPHEAAGQESDSHPVSCLQEGQAYEDAGNGQCNQEVVGRFPCELDRGSVRRSVRFAGVLTRAALRKTARASADDSACDRATLRIVNLITHWNDGPGDGPNRSAS